MRTNISGEYAESALYPEKGGSMFLRNVDIHLKDYTTSLTARPRFRIWLPSKLQAFLRFPFSTDYHSVTATHFL